VIDIPSVPSVLPIKRTNHIDLRVCKNISQSEPMIRSWPWRLHESEIQVQGNHKSLPLGASRLGFAALRLLAALSCGEKWRKENLLGPGHSSLSFARKSLGKNAKRNTTQVNSRQRASVVCDAPISRVTSDSRPSSLARHALKLTYFAVFPTDFRGKIHCSQCTLSAIQNHVQLN